MALNNSSLSFNGIDQYAKLGVNGSIRALSSFSFSAFFKVGDNSTKGTQHAYVERQGTGKGIRFRFTPIAGKLQFGFSAKDGVADTSYTYNTKWDDRWHHAVFSARLGERSTYEIILDGVVVLSGTLAVPDEVRAVSDTPSLGIYMGASSTNGTTFVNHWQGLIDDVAIHSNGMAQGTANGFITSLKRWDEQHDPSENETLDPNLLVYYPFDENTGTTSVDRGSTDVDNPEPNADGTPGTGTHYYHGPAQTATFYKGSVVSSTLWTVDRPYLGNGERDTVVPSVPGNPTTTVTASDAHDSFTATWTASTDNVWVQFYELQVSEFADFSTYMAFDNGRVLSKKVVGLLPATNYYWRVRAFDAELNASGYTTVRSLTTATSGDVAPPNPPTNLSASFVTHSSFRVSFTHSVSNDAVGYKIDISPKADFSEFLEGYRNQDIGNGTYVDVFGTSPLTSYYIRMRTYDAFDNESNDSVILRVNTPRQPDITPPLPANMLTASQVSATTALLRWSEGIDDTAVIGYYLDVSTAANFADYVTTETMYWESVDVGNVTSYRIEGLDPETTYYYRVRAYDEAGNVADNIVDPMQLTTEAYSLYEGGLMETEEFQIAWRENEKLSEPTPRVGDTTSLFIEYDLSGVVGSIQSVTLRLMPRTFIVPTTFGTIGIRAAQGDVMVTPVGTTIETSITQVDEFVEVDITPLVPLTEKYVLEIRSLGFTGYIDMGEEVADFNENQPAAPALVIISDPLSSSQPTDVEVIIEDHYRENLVQNPSFETSDVGWTTYGSGVSTVLGFGGTDGSRYLVFAGSVSGSGVIQSTHYAKIGPNEHTAASVDLFAVDGENSFAVRLIAYNNVGAEIGMFAETAATIETGTYKRVSLTGITPEGTERVRMAVVSTAASTFYGGIDNVTITNTEAVGSPFTGNFSRARWSGVANESTSIIASPTLTVISPYVGDANDNNSVTVSFRTENDVDTWIPVLTPVVTDRTLKQHRVTIGPSYGQYNYIINPSFETTSNYWSGGDRIENAGYVGNYGYNCTQSPYEATYTPRIYLEPGMTYSVQAQVLPDAGTSTHLSLMYYDNTHTLLSVSTSEYAYGDGSTWNLLTLTDEAPEAVYARILVVGNGAFVLDAVQFAEGFHKPYRDGDTLDGVWEGEPHNSTTGLQILPETVYDIKFDYYDPEGFFDVDAARTLTFVERFTTPMSPDDVFNAEPFSLTANENTVFVVLPYSGDDNNNSTVRMEFKRTDLTTWSELRPTYDRNRKQITTTIPNVRHGTNYTVRAIITDPDGVYGAENNIVMDSITTSYIASQGDTTPIISFGGFVLMGRDDTKIGVTGHDAFGFPERRVNVETLPRLDGGVEMQALWGTKSINMEGFVSGDSRADLEEVQRALKLGLAPRQQRLVIDTLSRRGRYYNATCESLQMEEQAEKNLRHLRWEAEFTCADPFAYDINESVLPTFTAPNNGTVSLVNEGDATVNPVLTITTPSSLPVNVTVVNESTGERIAPKSTIISGNRLIIDVERKSLTKNGVEIDYSGSFPRLAVGGNEFTFQLSIARTATSSTTTNDKVLPPTINVDMRWRHKFL